MANENMIQFLRGNVANLPQTATAGALYFTKDEGVYLGLEDGSYHRYGDFITVADVNSLPATGAHETCMYYCTSENILARYDSVKGWIQINKQPTAEEMKTLLGLGALAYKSEVIEGDLGTDLAAKINAASGAQHTHNNEDVLDGITAEKVAAWDSAEADAIAHADGLNTAMDTRVGALETAIGENGSVATQIKTAIEALDYTDTAVDGEYVSAVNEVDGKISVTRKALPDYSNTYDAKGAAETALDNAKAYADGLAANYDEKGAAAGVQTALEAEIAKKVDKVEGKSLIADTEIARLATLANYDDTQVKADIAKKADAETMTTELGKKVDKVDGYSLVADDEIARLADVDNYDDTALAGRVTAAEGKITALEGASATHATKDELGAVDAKFADYVTTESYATDKAGIDEAIADRYTKSEADEKFAIKGEDAYDDTELAGRVSAIEADYLKEADKYDDTALTGRVKAIEDDYLKAADKTALQDQITANANAITLLTDGVDPDKVDGVKDLIAYVDEHGATVQGLDDAIKANTKAIEDEAARADVAEKALAGRLDTLEAIDHEAYKDYADQAEADAKAYADAEVAKDRARLDALEAIDHNAYVAADTALKTELQKEIDDDVKALADTVYTKTEVEALLTWGSF